MKNLLTLLILCAPLLASAQLEKGNVLLTGSAQFWNNNYKYDFSPDRQVNKNFDAAIRAGVLVSPRFAIGLNAGYDRSTNKSNGTTSESNSFGIGPFVRYYHPITEKFYFVAQGVATFGNQKSVSTDPTRIPVTITDKYKMSDVTVSPGISYMFTEHLLFELYIGNLSFRSNKPVDDNNNNNTTETSQLRATFGISSIVPSLTFVF